AAEPRAAEARAPGSEGRSELVGAEDPGKDHADTLRPRDLAAQGDRRGHGGDPVEAIEDHECGQADSGRAERRIQPEQRDAAQSVVPEQEPAGVVAIRQPTRCDRADDVEYAD